MFLEVLGGIVWFLSGLTCACSPLWDWYNTDLLSGLLGISLVRVVLG